MKQNDLEIGGFHLSNQQIHVLLVEDETSDAKFLQDTLLGVISPIFTFSHVERLNMALQHLAWEEFDVVLLDLTLPDAHGLDTFIQVHAVAPDTPILILTSIDDEGLAVKAMQNGAQDYLVKGKLDTDLLLRSIRYAIERKGAEVERQKLLENTQHQSQLVQQILDTVNEGILTLNSKREIVLANPVAQQYLAILGAVGEGEELTELGGLPPEEFLQETDTAFPLEIIIEDGDHKRVFELHVSTSPLDQTEEGYTLLIRDTTAARQVQVQSQEQERQAAVGQLASGIAHDFNNIVGSIILYCEMLMNETSLIGKDRERLATILHQAQRAAGLTRQILDFSRTGLIEPHLVDLARFMEHVAKLLTRTLPENIRLSLLQKDDRHVVNVDPVRMQQVLMNLAVNARDAMPDGGELLIELKNISISDNDTLPVAEMSAGDWVRLTVADTGTGIEEEVLPHIFEPFYTTKGPGESSGLGLAQVDGIVKQHDGHIAVHSEIGKGTAIMIFLPSHHDDVEVALIYDQAVVKGEEKDLLLVVEDDFNTRTAVSEALQSHNFSVLCAGDGQEALEIIQKHNGKIDLVLSDLIMPRMSGLTLFRELKQNHPDIGMMVMTGYPMSDNTREMLEEGGVTWLAKPIHSRSLVRAVRKVLQQESVLAAS
jgi:signal transduction histidine kinase